MDRLQVQDPRWWRFAPSKISLLARPFLVDSHFIFELLINFPSLHCQQSIMFAASRSTFRLASRVRTLPRYNDYHLRTWWVKDDEGHWLRISSHEWPHVDPASIGFISNHYFCYSQFFRRFFCWYSSLAALQTADKHTLILVRHGESTWNLENKVRYALFHIDQRRGCVHGMDHESLNTWNAAVNISNAVTQSSADMNLFSLSTLYFRVKWLTWRNLLTCRRRYLPFSK